MLLGVIENIWDFFLRITTNGPTLDLLFYVGVGFITLMVLFFIVKSHYAYEGRLERSLEKINRWLFTHQQIDESNLIEFNSLVKKAPRLLRYHWQQYMLYREHEPSHYLSVYNCIEKPLHTSSYNANIKNYIGICGATMLVVFLLSLVSYGNSAVTIASIAIPFITPTIILILSVIFLILLRAMQNFNISSLYQNFHLFNRYIDKASATIPKYVDFEILFTRKEIRGGIPVLNEYLEKRARQEAEELEKARQNAVEHEVYNFEKSGIDGALVLERAMKETETFINAKQRILTEIQQYESEIDSLKRNYENTSKDYQRKLQASKENIERFRAQQEESTNRIEVNFIRKQQQDEIKKQEQLEKDQDDATMRYQQETTSLQSQIDERKKQLEEKKQYVQFAMTNEYQTFSEKVFKKIKGDIEEKHKEEIDELAEQKIEAIQELEKTKEINAIKDSVINDLRELIHKNPDEVETVSETEQPVIEEPVKDSEQPIKENIELDPAKDMEKVEEKPVEEIVEEPKQEELKPQEEESVIENEVKEEPVIEQEQPAEKVEVEENSTENVEEQETGDAEGFYDENGYYWFANGTYYDDKGLYHDEDGRVYDADGNLVADIEQPENTNTQEQLTEKVEVEGNKPENTNTQEQTGEEDATETTLVNDETDIDDKVQDEVAEENNETQDKQEDLNEGADFVYGGDVESNGDYTEQEDVAPAKRRGRPKKEITEEPKKTTGKRGRPKKETTEEPKKTTGKRGRPKKEVSTEVEEPKKTTGKRGRPKKETTEEPKKTTGKRGRPKKEVSTEVEEVKKTTGKRGRPKKEITEEPKKTTGKRGRPKKNTTELAAISSQILEETNKLMAQQNDLNKQLGEALDQMKDTDNDDDGDANN